MNPSSFACANFAVASGERHHGETPPLRFAPVGVTIRAAASARSCRGGMVTSNPRDLSQDRGGRPGFVSDFAVACGMRVIVRFLWQAAKVTWNPLNLFRGPGGRGFRTPS